MTSQTETSPAAPSAQATPNPLAFSIEAMLRERCDRCGFRAVVQTLHLHEDGERLVPLSWCGHHYNEAAPAMTLPTDMVVHNIASTLTANESVDHA